jgi:hypothetical protein
MSNPIIRKKRKAWIISDTYSPDICFDVKEVNCPAVELALEFGEVLPENEDIDGVQGYSSLIKFFQYRAELEASGNQDMMHDDRYFSTQFILESIVVGFTRMTALLGEVAPLSLRAIASDFLCDQDDVYSMIGGNITQACQIKRVMERQDKILSIIEEKQKSKPPIFKTANNHYLEWEGHSFRHATEIELAKELDSRGVTFFPSAGIRVTDTTTGDRKTLEPDFLIFHHGKFGVLELDGDSHREKHYADAQRARIFKRQGILIIEHYPSTMPPSKIVDDFLEILESS